MSQSGRVISAEIPPLATIHMVEAKLGKIAHIPAEPTERGAGRALLLPPGQQNLLLLLTRTDAVSAKPPITGNTNGCGIARKGSPVNHRQQSL